MKTFPNIQSNTRAPDEIDSAQGILLPALPYPEYALEPVISASTIGLHYGKHHRTYVDNVKRLVVGTTYADMTIENIIKATSDKVDLFRIFNNAAQAWNHSFYWQNMRAHGGGTPPLALKHKLEESFGSVEDCKKELINAAVAQFASGWVWLVHDGKKLRVIKTGNAGTPISHGLKPLLTLDVWEHAYYLDYQNRRADYAMAFVEKLINWAFAEENLGSTGIHLKGVSSPQSI